MLTDAAIAERAGLTLHDLNELLGGRVTQSVADALGVAPGDVEAFIRANGSVAMTQRLGFENTGTAVNLARATGRAGAIGVITGLLLSV